MTTNNSGNKSLLSEGEGASAMADDDDDDDVDPEEPAATVLLGALVQRGRPDDAGDAAAAADDVEAKNKATSNDGDDDEMQQQQQQQQQLGEEEEKGSSSQERCCGCFRCCGCWTKCRASWPRTYELVFSVVVPAFVLILVSFAFGYALSRLESPAEFDRNDAILRRQFKFQSLATINANVTSILPALCLRSYVAEQLGNDGNVTSLDDLLDNITRFIDEALDSSEDDDGDMPFRRTMTKMLDAWKLKEELKERLRNWEADMRRNNNITIADGLPSYLAGECEEKVLPVITKLFEATATMAEEMTADTITLDWSRCPAPPESGGGDGNKNVTRGGAPASELLTAIKFDKSFFESISPDRQMERYTDIFFAELYDGAEARIAQYLAASAAGYETTETNETGGGGNEEPLLKLIYSDEHFPSVKAAYVESAANATGRAGCYSNIPASVWFWFTVMTTIGYGNTTVHSTGGRAMVYTLGFLSILLFGGITARAGTIVSEMFDEAGDYYRALRWTKRSATAALLIRAAFYYLWVLVIAHHYRRWQQQRLDATDVGLNDGYWFGYISTTTVGLGDYYLDPAVIAYDDLFSYPLLFLFGFFLLAAFLGKLAEVLGVLTKSTTNMVAEFGATATEKAIQLLHRPSSGGKDADKAASRSNSRTSATRNPDRH